MRVFIAEDQFLLRRGLEDLLAAHGIDVVGSVADGSEILSGVRAGGADLALLDIRMPPTNTDEGIRAALALRAAQPGFPVVLLSQYVEELYLDELLSDGAGGVGYLLKDRVFDDVQFVHTLRAVQAGSTSVDPEVIARLMRRRTVQTKLSRLTAREYEVLSHMAEGDSNTQIAEKLFVTEKAVAKHINSMFAKLDLPESNSNARRVLAVLAFLRQ
ncbi:response regulator transcription factor [Granulicoccus sp. GXG6511]|uniref:response regulator transcription factor n=1 Tax=Granulicoccus sp. GXG6511 TaxID=3381351 RepID=UPI003D7CA985